MGVGKVDPQMGAFFQILSRNTFYGFEYIVVTKRQYHPEPVSCPSFRHVEPVAVAPVLGSDLHVAPSEPTIRRVLQGVDVDALDAAIGAWLLGTAGFEAVAVDGKVLKDAVRAEGLRRICSARSCMDRESPSRKRKSPGKPTKF